MRSLLILFFVVSLVCTNKATAQDFEWNVDNTGSSPGERVVAVLDAKNVGTYTGVELWGQVIDNNGNWGYHLPTIAEFRLYVRFSGGISFGLVQTQKTNHIFLGLRKISDSKVHLVANCPYNHMGMRVLLKKIEGYTTVTLGDPTTITSTGELLTKEPRYFAFLNSMVGVGVEEPDAQMCIGKWNAGNAGEREGVQLRLSGLHNSGTNLGGVKLLIEGYDNDGSTTYPIYIKDENSNIDYWIKNRPSASSDPVMYFAGNIGIGTTSPKTKLDVAGTIRATEIKVEAKTADFVFSDDYPLRELKVVEKFIKENNHLPDIPSAKEMETSGVNLAEMNKLLLQKIEELTLYAIERDKEVREIKEDRTRETKTREELEAEIKRQKAEMKMQKTDLEAMKNELSEIKALLLNR